MSEWQVREGNGAFLFLLIKTWEAGVCMALGLIGRIRYFEQSGLITQLGIEWFVKRGSSY